MGLWDRIQKDIQKSIDESISAMRKGATVAVEKAEELAAEGKRRYRIFELKMKVQSDFTDLGGKVYDLASKESKNPLSDAKVKSAITGIKKLEAQIAKLEKGSVKKSTKGSRKSKTKRK